MHHFPFSAVVGADDLTLALALTAVSPDIGGVLVRGEKGTAKSTAVRALTSLLPEVRVVAGCRFSCDPDRPDAGCPDGPHQRPAAVCRPARPLIRPLPQSATGAASPTLGSSLRARRGNRLRTRWKRCAFAQSSKML